MLPHRLQFWLFLPGWLENLWSHLSQQENQPLGFCASQAQAPCCIPQPWSASLMPIQAWALLARATDKSNLRLSHFVRPLIITILKRSTVFWGPAWADSIEYHRAQRFCISMHPVLVAEGMRGKLSAAWTHQELFVRSLAPLCVPLSD